MDQPRDNQQSAHQRKRSRLGKGIGLILLLACYLLGHPWLIYGTFHLPSPVDDIFFDFLLILYAPFDFTLDHIETLDSVYEWYFSILEEIFPGYFKIAF